MADVMAQPGLVSVMMPAYNAAPYIGDAIESLLAQSYDAWELLLVNDGSTDATREVAGAFRDPRIRLFDQANGGESTARNLALDHARGEFVAYLDADDAYFPHHLEATVDFLRARADRDAVYTDGFHIDEHGLRLAALQSRRRGPFDGRIYEQVVRASDVFGPPVCVVLRRAVVEAHALRYDPRIVIGPDWDFFVRVADVATFGYLPDRTTLYRVHSSNVTTRVNARRRAESLALCRENAVRMRSFASCSVETRAAVFYDLAVNLRRGLPDERAAALSEGAFRVLPAHEQARLLRLAAADSILHDGDRRHVAGWLRRARALNPSDRRAGLLSAAYRVSPALSYTALRVLETVRGTPPPVAPFADLTSQRRNPAPVGASPKRSH